MKNSTTRLPIHGRMFQGPGLLLASVLCLGCGGPAPLTVDMPLHLEDHLDAATIVASEVPADILAPVEWRFDEPQPDWKPFVPLETSIKPIDMTSSKDALRLTLTEANRLPWRSDGSVWGSMYVDLPDYRLADWGSILVRARTSDQVRQLGVSFNLRDTPLSGVDPPFLAQPRSHGAPVINDGSVHTYAFEADRLSAYPPRPAGWRRAGSRDWEHPWQQLGIRLSAREPASFDLLSVTIVPAEAAYAHAPVGVRTEIQGKTHRRTLYTHAPGRLEYLVKVPADGRLDVGLGVLREDAPVSFRITAKPEGGEADTLFEESYADHRRWALRSVDLSHLAGRIATLALEADAERAGTVALWAAPTLTGARATEKPNIIFYVIDGGDARMSLYGYNRRTTPNLERLAGEGALFEHAYSNSTHTEVSTPSFATSLHSSVLGGHDPLPDQAVTMAERLHRAGYQTALFTSNPYAGQFAGLERGVDVFRDAGVSDSASSVQLHEDYGRWREVYPGEPYFVHFQTTDVHGPYPFSPFAGLYVSPELRETYYEWERQLDAYRPYPWSDPDSAAYAETGISKVAYFHERRGLYDEAMAHQDYQLGRLVERLKAAGEWEHTLLIVASDHGTWYADPSSTGTPTYDPMLGSDTRVPLLIVWPGRIAGGQRFSQPVSMIDVLPTMLDLVGLPMPEVMQGQSLAPLLLGEEGWDPRPVILDEFEVDPETSELTGVIEVVDGRWGASLLIKPRPGAWPESRRAAPLLLYDLWNDPYTQHSLHEERPDLVEKYTAFLEAQFEAHQPLAQLFTRSDPVALTPEQLRTLRALGYIQ